MHVGNVTVVFLKLGESFFWIYYPLQMTLNLPGKQQNNHLHGKKGQSSFASSDTALCSKFADFFSSKIPDQKSLISLKLQTLDFSAYNKLFFVDRRPAAPLLSTQKEFKIACGHGCVLGTSAGMRTCVGVDRAVSVGVE